MKKATRAHWRYQVLSRISDGVRALSEAGWHFYRALYWISTKIDERAIAAIEDVERAEQEEHGPVSRKGT